MSQDKLNQKALDEIIENFKDFFKKEIAQNHVNNTVKLVRLKAFNLNPFLDKYKARFLTGQDDAKSIAKALVYARTLGPSINTIFGNQLQKYCSQILKGFGSTTQGIDIEFIDMVDGRKKYCQIKAGPNTINRDDVTTIKNHFDSVRNLARTNNLDIGLNDLIVGVFYGTPDQLSNHYKNIDKDYPVIIGKDFWHRLTGHANFYDVLGEVMGEIALEYDGTELLEEVIGQLAKEIETALQSQKNVSEENQKQLNKESKGKIRELREKYEVK
ncbi:PmeII family type II restriction endonuclease [Oceanobacillus alkalisoli]|uniref:PmeII family type II restriction endonuclease n=1 Tax=Oceanobacillus alkalisoli TaxID=2925113 RepID=UPI001EE4193E|nr:PmeII family type II restriction endonuclease [Oceanobacillus alkalisoli]MCG5103207.1 restriction endonuclease [Oceanobacillus alkalisoli]